VKQFLFSFLTGNVLWSDFAHHIRFRNNLY
jgi:hypothetical protein